MTHHLETREYGQAGCCRCARLLDLAAGPPALVVEYGNLLLYLCHCPSCYCDVLALDEGDRHESLAKAINICLGAMPDSSRLAVTTSVALQAHRGDLVKAYEVGVHLPRWLHDALVVGETEASLIPSDIWEVA